MIDGFAFIVDGTKFLWQFSLDTIHCFTLSELRFVRTDIGIKDKKSPDMIGIDNGVLGGIKQIKIAYVC